MKKIIAIFIIAILIGMTPSFAVEISETNKIIDPMNIKGKGTDEDTTSELTEQNEVNQTIETNNEAVDKGENASETIDQDVILVEEQNIENGDIKIREEFNSDLQNSSTDDEDNTQINTTGIIMQSTNYTCGPAALATVLNNLGINATEQELMVLAGTDENGTTMYGLVQAAKSKGLNATGMKLKIEELKKNNIVFLTIDGATHYSIINEITNESVKLADPSLGNIEMSIGDFEGYYSGYALLISNPNMYAQEINQTEDRILDKVISIQAENIITLTEGEMQTIKGQRGLPYGPIGILLSILFFAWDHGLSSLANKVWKDLKKQISINVARKMYWASRH